MMFDQMELGLAARNSRGRRQRGAERRQRAQWWFARMRNVVDATLEWRPAPRARPEQVFMSLPSGSR
jgi:hypothetical protein